MTDTSERLPVLPGSSRLDELARLGMWLAASESGANDEKSRGATAALRLYYAMELGLTPMAAAELSVIRGRLYVGAQLHRALAVREGYRVFRIAADENACTARLVRDGIVLGESTFTMDDAKKAGLVRANSPWITHPARMLWARASKNVIVDFAPEVALGMALDDEIQEVPEDKGGIDRDSFSDAYLTEPAPVDNEAEREAEEFWPDRPADQEQETLAELAQLIEDEDEQ